MATITQAASSTAYPATAATAKNGERVCTARPEAPVTTVPTGNVNDHHASENGGRARAVTVAATAAQSRARPHTGTPYSTANPRSAPAAGAGRTPPAAPPSRHTAVTDWPSGPSTMNSIGTAPAGPAPCRASRASSCRSTTTEPATPSPNSA